MFRCGQGVEFAGGGYALDFDKDIVDFRCYCECWVKWHYWSLKIFSASAVVRRIRQLP